MSKKTEVARGKVIKRGPVFSPVRMELVERLTKEAETLSKDIPRIVRKDTGQQKRMVA